jgi:hypothetical protein
MREMKMKTKSLAVILAVMVFAGIAVGQTTANAGATATAGNTPSAIRILAPNPGEKLTESAVTVEFQLENPGLAAGGFPNFSIQLDGRDPVITAQTSQNFTGLAPGPHTVVVQLLDANSTPIGGARAETQFNVAAAAQQPAPAAQPQPARPPTDQASAALPQGDDAALTDQGEILPAASSALPLLSVVGFGALVGGVISALRTR